MNHTYYMPRRFRPTYSVLGRWLRRRSGDERHAEALFILAVVGLALVLLLAQYLAWVLLKDALTAEPLGPVALGFWGGHLAAFLLFFFGAVLGFKPAITVTRTAEALHIQQGGKRHAYAYATMQQVTPISALRFHRHWRRYAQTQVFVNKIEDPLLLLHTTHGPVVLGLAEEDLHALKTALEARIPPEFATPQPAFSAA